MNSLFGEPIVSFSDEYRWLSNFWPVYVEFDGVTYTSVEHAYVASKTTDLNMRKIVATTESPGKVKRIGRTLTLRSDWDDVRIAFMTSLIDQKFDYIPLAQKLKATGDRPIIEGNTWGDTFWGQSPLGNGENNLGKIIMNKREKLNDLS